MKLLSRAVGPGRASVWLSRRKRANFMSASGLVQSSASCFVKYDSNARAMNVVMDGQQQVSACPRIPL